jgi:hypothetical protein
MMLPMAPTRLEMCQKCLQGVMVVVVVVMMMMMMMTIMTTAVIVKLDAEHCQREPVRLLCASAPPQARSGIISDKGWW